MEHFVDCVGVGLLQVLLRELAWCSSVISADFVM